MSNPLLTIYKEAQQATRGGTKHCVFLEPDSLKGVGEGDRTEEIRRQWEEFLDKDLPRIEEAVRSEPWIWEPTETEPEQVQ